MPTMTDEQVTVGGRTYRLHATGRKTEEGWGYHLIDLNTDGRPLAFVYRCWVPGRDATGGLVPCWGWRAGPGGPWYAESAALVTAVLAARERSAA